MRRIVWAYLCLAAAIVLEVAGTLLLPKVNNFKPSWYMLGIGVLYTLSFLMLTFVLNNIQISVAYTTWAGMGVALVSIFGYILYDDRFTKTTAAGVVTVIVGIVLVNLRYSEPGGKSIVAPAKMVGDHVPVSPISTVGARTEGG